MITESIWRDTKTFFPLFREAVRTALTPNERVCIVGASDGKFVLPFARDRRLVEAIEKYPTALNGGIELFPGDIRRETMGLRGRLLAEGLSRFVSITEGDFLECPLPQGCGAVFTSCSWHYSMNHREPLSRYVGRMCSILKPGGIFCAEYMMPVEEKHLRTEHYPPEGGLRRLFKSGWQIIEEFYTEPFVEAAHVGNLTDHMHRMGFLMAIRT